MEGAQYSAIEALRDVARLKSAPFDPTTGPTFSQRSAVPAGSPFTAVSLP